MVVQFQATVKVTITMKELTGFFFVFGFGFWFPSVSSQATGTMLCSIEWAGVLVLKNAYTLKK